MNSHLIPLFQTLELFSNKHGGESMSEYFQEKEDAYLFSFDMPGLKEEDINVEIKGEELMISALRKGPLARKYFQKIHLTEGINQEKIEAQYVQGVLTLVLPKIQIQKTQPRKIKINSSESNEYFKEQNPSQQEYSN